MTSPLPPRLRDTRNYVDRVRQDRQNLKQLGVGFVGGRFAPAKPLGTTAQMGDLEDDESLEDDTQAMAGWNTDRATCATAGIIHLNLTYVPVDGTLHVRWDGDDLHPTEWTLVGQALTFADPHIHVGDGLTTAYFYWPSDVPVPVITSPADGSTTLDTTPTITGTGVAGSAMEVFIDDLSVGTTTVADDNTWTLTPVSALSLGAHTVTATQTTDTATLEADPVAFSVVTPSAATATPRTATSTWGTSSSRGGAGLPLPLPSGAQVGDLIVVSAISSGSINVADSRLTHVGNNMWIGWATDLSAVAVTFGSPWYAITCNTIATNATAWTAAAVSSDTSVAIGDTLSIPPVPIVAVALCATTATVFGFGACAISTPASYTSIGATNNPLSAEINLWTDTTVSGSPASSVTYSGGGSGAIYATVVGLIGP